MNIHWMHRKKIELTVRQKIKPTDVVLDIGCGIRPQKFQKPLIHICCEPFGQYIEELQKIICRRRWQDRFIVIQSDWSMVVKMFPPLSVDTIYLIDVVEHLPKKEALRLLKKTEKIARKQIIIFTPLGFLAQRHPDGKDAWGMNGGKMQEHQSGWEPSDFDDSWDIYATHKYHTTDNLGHFYKKPYGAFYAIKEITLSPKKDFHIWQNSQIQDLVEFSQKLLKRIKRFINLKNI